MTGPRTSGAMSVDITISDLDTQDNIEEIARRTNGTIEENHELADGKGLEIQIAFDNSIDAHEFRRRVSRNVSGVSSVGPVTPAGFREFQ